MDLSAQLDPVLAIARASAHEVDATARFPEEAVAALRASGLLGLTLPTEPRSTDECQVLIVSLQGKCPLTWDDGSC